MPIEFYQGTTIETTWEPGEGWYYSLGSDKCWGPFDSEEEAIQEAEDMIDSEVWE